MASIASGFIRKPPPNPEVEAFRQMFADGIGQQGAK